MHELAIAGALIDLVRKRAGEEKVSAVGIELGALTGIVPDCLAFYFEGLTRGTSLDGARLACRLVPARVRCPACGGVYGPESSARVCPACGALGGEVLAGDELDLVRIERWDGV